MQEQKKNEAKKKDEETVTISLVGLTDWLTAGILAVVSAVLYFASLAGYAYPGVSAHLQAVWQGLDVTSAVEYPLMAVFAKALGGGNLLAPVSGVLAVVSLFLLVTAFGRSQMTIADKAMVPQALKISRIAGIAAAVVFMLTPAVRSAATHLEPTLFDAMLAMVALLGLIAYAKVPKKVSLLVPMAIGSLFALGFCDSALFLVLAPFTLIGIALVAHDRKIKPYLPAFLCLLSAFITYLVAVSALDVDSGEVLKNVGSQFKFYYSVTGWLFVTIFTTVPCVAILFSTSRAYGEKPGLVQWLYHLAMTFVAILAVATPLAPSALMEPFGYLPVVSSAFAAVVVGHLVSYWWMHRRRAIALAAGSVLALVTVISLLMNLFAFNSNAGAFADRVAEKIIEDMGPRKWFVSDGSLDEHIMLTASRLGRDVKIVSMDRDLDTAYLERLADMVRDNGLGGERNAELALSARLGVLPFVQDWLANDPTVKTNVVIYAVPDLWNAANHTAVPEFLFFGADAARKPDTAAWKEFDSVLAVPKGWGSYRNRRTDSPLDRLRFHLRRHIGFVANNRGVYLEDNGQKDEAYDTYEQVLREIDPDNVCALFNEIEMGNRKYPKAVARLHEHQRAVKAIVEDHERRYQLWWLSRYYGYIRNPDMFVRLGYAWARSGRAGDALAHLRRAIDFSGDERKMSLMNMMAALYAAETKKTESRRIYEAILAKDPKNHDALIGMMRLELLEGNEKAAIAYLDRAAAVSPEGVRSTMVERAMAAMMRGELGAASDILKKLVENDKKDLQSWALLATVTMQRADAEKDAKRREALEKELSTSILPSMEKNSEDSFDYYVQTTKAFALLRQGDKKRKEARDSFAVAAKARPDIAPVQDITLGLDISLNDIANAETHAREILRRNRNAPLANYAMGSLALNKGDNEAAEMYLTRAVDTRNPNVMALNDLAELYRRTKRSEKAIPVIRRALKVAPKMYVCWETLASSLLEVNGDLKEAEAAARKACELCRDDKGRETDVRMLITLARVLAKKGDVKRAKGTIRRIRDRVSEMSEFERREFEEFVKSVK